jgi:hypothetical protein
LVSSGLLTNDAASKPRETQMSQHPSASTGGGKKLPLPAAHVPEERATAGAAATMAAPPPKSAPELAEPRTDDESTRVAVPRKSQPLAAMQEMGFNSRGSLLVEDSVYFAPVLSGATTNAPPAERSTAAAAPGPLANLSAPITEMSTRLKTMLFPPDESEGAGDSADLHA